MWRAGFSYCFLAESLCPVRESDSVLILQAELWGPVWSESGSVPNLSRQGALCSSVLCTYIEGEPAEPRGGVQGVREEEGESGVPAVEGQPGECQEQDIVQHSASEQTHMSPCIWYSKQM